MTTTASHVITSLISLDKHIASRASFPVQEILLKVFITGPFVFFKHTLRTIHYFALLACVNIISHLNNSVTFLFRT